MAGAEYLASSLMLMGLSGTRISAYLDDVRLHACGRVDDGHGTGQQDVGKSHHGQRHAHDAGEGVRLAHGACREGGGGRGQWVRAGKGGKHPLGAGLKPKRETSSMSSVLMVAVPWMGKVRGGTPKQKAATPKNREKACPSTR